MHAPAPVARAATALVCRPRLVLRQRSEARIWTASRATQSSNAAAATNATRVRCSVCESPAILPVARQAASSATGSARGSPRTRRTAAAAARPARRRPTASPFAWTARATSLARIAPLAAMCAWTSRATSKIAEPAGKAAPNHSVGAPSASPASAKSLARRVGTAAAIAAWIWKAIQRTVAAAKSRVLPG